MAAVSAWGKPGAWALDSEAHEAEQRDKAYDSSDSAAATAAPTAPSADFPSLSAAAATKPARKKKPQTLSLAEFATGHSVSHGAAAKQSLVPPSYKGLTSDELAALPTGPRERSADELERSSRGFGYSSYGLGRGGPRDGPRGGGASDEPRRTREPSRDLGPSRADEIDDWGAAKKSMAPQMLDRRGRGSGFSDNNPSRADDSDSWVSKRSGPPPPAEGRRSSGFDRERNREGIDSESWGRKSSNEINANGRSNYRDGIDADSWGKKKEDVNNTSEGRPRLVLQPRTSPLANDDGNAEQKDQQLPQPRKLAWASGNANVEQEEEQQQPPKKTSNPFGAARPREEVLAEKGQDWKKIDEKLETMKIREVATDSGRKGFGVGSAKVDDRTTMTWRKPADAVVASSSPSPSAEKGEEKSADN